LGGPVTLPRGEKTRVQGAKMAATEKRGDGKAANGTTFKFALQAGQKIGEVGDGGQLYPWEVTGKKRGGVGGAKTLRQVQ